MFLIRDVVFVDPSLSITLGEGGVTHYTPASCCGTRVVPGQLVEEAFQILLIRLTVDITFKITEGRRIMTGEEADVEYCTVDFIKQDLVSSVYKTLASVVGIQKGREMGFWVCEKGEECTRGFPLLPSLLHTQIPFPFPFEHLSCRLASYLYTVLYYSIDLISPECNISSFVS